jgi:hypothetical protein
MPYSDIILTDQNSTKLVAGGKGIVLQATLIKYDAGVMLQVDPIPGKNVTQEHNDILAYGDFIGIENGAVSVDGVIDLSQYDITTGDPPNPPAHLSPTAYAVVTVKILQQIYKSGHIFKLEDLYKDSTALRRISGLSGSLPNETVDDLYVQCKGISIETDTSTEEGTKLKYTLSLAEVRH